MCKNNLCFYDYESTLTPEALVLSEMIPVVNANREEKNRISLDDLLKALEAGAEVDELTTIQEEASTPEVEVEINLVDDPEVVEDVIQDEELVEVKEEADIPIFESKDKDKYEILLDILNRTYNPTEYKDEYINMLRILYKESENDYVKQLLKEALLKLVYETIK